MMDNQRHLFSLRPDIHYLNCAYKAPLLKSAEEAAVRALIRERNPIDITPADFFKEAAEVRQLFGELVNCPATDVAIIPSTSYGFSSVLNNIAPQKGQHAICVENEFSSDYFSIRRWCDHHGAELKVVKADTTLAQVGEDWNQKILESINESTAVVILSSVHWMSGLKFDLEEIGKRCRSVGAKFIVDGTQSVGALPIDVKKYHIDALVCASYKWLLGPYSLGLAYIGDAFHGGIPVEESWLNRTNAEDFSNLTSYSAEYTPGAGRYNVGEYSNFILMPMLRAALVQIKEWSVQEIQTYCHALVQPLQVYLAQIGVQLEERKYSSPHLFGMKLPETIEAKVLQENLLKSGVYLSARGGLMRVSVNVFNTRQDIEKLIEVIAVTKEQSAAKGV